MLQDVGIVWPRSRVKLGRFTSDVGDGCGNGSGVSGVRSRSIRLRVAFVQGQNSSCGIKVVDFVKTAFMPEQKPKDAKGDCRLTTDVSRAHSFTISFNLVYCCFSPKTRNTRVGFLTRKHANPVQ